MRDETEYINSLSDKERCDLGIGSCLSVRELKDLEKNNNHDVFYLRKELRESINQIESLEKIIELKNKQLKVINDKYKELDDECNYLTSLINELRLNFSEVNDFINALNKKLECNK